MKFPNPVVNGSIVPVTGGSAGIHSLSYKITGYLHVLLSKISEYQVANYRNCNGNKVSYECFFGDSG